MEHAREVNSARFSPDGALLGATAADGTIRVWRQADRSPLWDSVTDGGSLSTLAFSPDGALVVAAGYSGVIRAWSAATGGTRAE